MRKPTRITVDAAVAKALRGLAIGEFRDGEVQANGDVIFEIDPEVTAKLEEFRKPGDDDASLLRRILKVRGGIDVPPKKSN
jgi:hypothetical protein